MANMWQNTYAHRTPQTWNRMTLVAPAIIVEKPRLPTRQTTLPGSPQEREYFERAGWASPSGLVSIVPSTRVSMIEPDPTPDVNVPVGWERHSTTPAGHPYFVHPALHVITDVDLDGPDAARMSLQAPEQNKTLVELQAAEIRAGIATEANFPRDWEFFLKTDGKTDYYYVVNHSRCEVFWLEGKDPVTGLMELSEQEDGVERGLGTAAVRDKQKLEYWRHMALYPHRYPSELAENELTSYLLMDKFKSAADELASEFTSEQCRTYLEILGKFSGGGPDSLRKKAFIVTFLMEKIWSRRVSAKRGASPSRPESNSSTAFLWCIRKDRSCLSGRAGPNACLATVPESICAHDEGFEHCCDNPLHCQHRFLGHN